MKHPNLHTGQRVTLSPTAPRSLVDAHLPYLSGKIVSGAGPYNVRFSNGRTSLIAAENLLPIDDAIAMARKLIAGR